MKKGNVPPNKLPEGTPSWYFRNKERFTEQRKIYKLNNPEKVREAQHRAAKKLYDIKRNIVTDYKSKPCMDCDITYPYYVMDLDHVRGSKTFNVGANLKSIRMELLILELEKCEVVCANCHRIRTHTSQT